MYQKLDNAAWEKYINEYSSLDNKISIKSCLDDFNDFDKEPKADEGMRQVVI